MGLNRNHSSLEGIGTLGTPTSGVLKCVAKKGIHDYTTLRLDFELTNVRIPVTDAAGSGSYGSVKLMDLVEGAWHFVSSRQNYSAFTEGAALTTAAGDAAFDIGVGTAAIAAAADGVLTGSATYDNIGAKVDVTLGSTSLPVSLFDAADATVDGTATALDIVLNWSGTAATIDANSYIDVSGTISVVMAFVGDD